MTRKKGGTKAAVAPPLTAGDVTGLIILTSASASEAAQESALLGGSFFTHALVTGLRGAADEDSDFIVTVDEAYSYAYHATLVLTEATRGGPQHATRELELRGTGAIGLADLRRKTSALVLDDHFAGRFAIYDARQRNVAEVTKKEGRASSIAFAPGTYQVFFDAVDGVRKATVTLVPDRSVRASALRFIEVATSDTVTRGVTPTLSPRGRALAENAYRMQAIRLKPGLLGSKRVVQGDTEVPLDGSTFYRVVGREDLFAETQGRAAWQTGLWTAGTILAGVGGAVCLGGVAAVAWGDDERWERSPLQTTGAFLVLPGVCALGTGVCTASASTLIPVDPLSQEDREVLIEAHNATTRRGLGLMAH